ncbi:MAG: glycosyltransferase family 4 protein [Marinobacterium sp.]|nr:glycosyltransferase family 4 protein [Marinobacterium sp.]
MTAITQTTHSRTTDNHHLLIIGYVWPESRSSAAGTRMMELIRCFRQQQWQVTFASPAQRSEHMDDLATLQVECHAIALNCSSFDQWLAQQQPTMVLFDRFMMEEQFGWRVAETSPQALRLLESCDLHCLRNARHQALKQQREMTDADLRSDMALREIAAIYRCDLTLMISDYEQQLLQQTFSVPAQLLHHLPFMLDADAIVKDSTTLPTFEQRQHFITIGNFRHEPNWDAVRYLKEAVWPLIRKQLPDAQLHIYGAYPPPKATQLHNEKQGFLVKGWADDAHTVMRQARVCLAPLRFGAGIKGKLADSMINGTPSVTTETGAEGMPGELDWSGLIAQSPQQLADAAVTLYQDEALWQQKQQQGFRIICQRFDQQALGPTLIERITQIYNQLEQHRLANFTGMMLNHHHQRSTRFMSQWIEAKTKLADIEKTAESA